MPDDNVTCPCCLGWGHLAPFCQWDDEEPVCPLCGGAGEIDETAARKAQAEARAERADLEDS